MAASVGDVDDRNDVNVQEITRQNPGRPGGQELPPGRRCPARRGPEPGHGQDPAGRSRADSVPEAEELTLDTPVPPPRVLPGQPPDQLTDLLRDRQAPPLYADRSTYS
jgi:hypothetical protein